jgi:RNA polymerase sigma factor (sigma-70 family)
MIRQLTITQDKFERLLGWLDADREVAGRRYEEIRQSLIKILTWRGCAEAEDMADEVINRVADKLPKLLPIYKGDPALYFYGVAKRVLQEYRGREKQHVPLNEINSPQIAPAQGQEDDPELMDECLKRCLQELSPHNRETITAYYLMDKQAKIDSRKEIAQQTGVAINTLRVRMYRIRATLEQCIKRCLEQNK